MPNPRRVLLPGMFVTLRLTEGELEHAFVLPQAALSRDAQGAYVMVVGADGKVQQRRVESHGMTRSDWILTGDLADGDQVIVAGLQKVKPGAVATVASDAPVPNSAAESGTKPTGSPIGESVAEPADSSATAPAAAPATTTGGQG